MRERRLIASFLWDSEREREREGEIIASRDIRSGGGGGLIRRVMNESREIRSERESILRRKA